MEQTQTPTLNKVNDHLQSAIQTFLVAFMISLAAQFDSGIDLATMGTAGIISIVSVAARAGIKELTVWLKNTLSSNL